LWECNGEYDKAVVKEAGGVLVPVSELSVHERLRQNCDSYRSVKETGTELIESLRSLRAALLADSNSVVPRNVGEDIGSNQLNDGSTHNRCEDAATNSSKSNSVSRNSSSETRLIHDVGRHHGETVDVSYVRSTECDLQAGSNATAAGNIINTEHAILQIQPVDMDASNPTSNGLLMQESVKNQLPGTDDVKRVSSAISPTMESSQVITNHQLVKYSS